MRALVLAGLWLLTPVTAEACRISRPFPPVERARDADLVVVGRVSHYRWVEQPDNMFGGHAEFDIAVIEAVKGRAAATVHATSRTRLFGPANPWTQALLLIALGAGGEQASDQFFVLQDICSGAFVTPAGSIYAKATRDALAKGKK